MEDLKFTTAGDYMAWYNSTLTDRYESYVILADNGEGVDTTTGEPLLTFDEWLNC